MNKTNSHRCWSLGAAIQLTLATSTFAQSSWQPVDAISPWQGAAIIADPSGNFISLALSTNSTTTPVSTLVSRSGDGGLTWQSVGSIGGYALKLAAAPDGTLYASGNRSATVSGKAFVWTSLDHGATWTFATDPWAGQSSTLMSMDIRADSAGALYLAGWLSGGNHWIVRKGLPGGSGLSWTTVDNFQISSGQPQGLHVRPAPVADQPDEVFICGIANGLWTVRHTLNAGVTWATLDNYSFGTQQSAYSLATAPDGSIYVLGRVAQSILIPTLTTNIVHHQQVVTTNYTSSTQYGWLVRKSANGGTSWSNVDYVTNGWPAYARGMAVDTFGRVLTVGFLSTNSYCWLVRGSVDGGATWTTTDSFLPPSFTNSQAASIASDPLGNVCVLGTLTDANATDEQAVVRRLAAP